MARHLEGETKRKFAIANASLEACEEFLTDPAVVNLGSNLAKRALSLLDLVYVPNMRDGVYDLAYRDEDDPRIPFIVADQGEDIKMLRNPVHAVHPWMWDSIRNKIAKIDIDEMTDEAFRNIKGWIAQLCLESNGEIISVDTNLDAYAFVNFEASAIGIDRKKGEASVIHGVETRPMIIGNAARLQLHEARSNLYHELIHVIQFLRGDNSVYRPGKHRTWTLRRGEIEAYSNQAIAEEAYYGVKIEENPYRWTSMGIEAIRREINSDKKDPYRASKRMMKMVSDHNLRIEQD